MIYPAVLLSILLASSPRAFAHGADRDAVRLLEFTTKKKTLMLGIGHLDGIKPTQKAMIVVEKGGDYTNLGKAEAVKVFAGYSIWTMEVPTNYPLKKDQLVMLRDQTEFFSYGPGLKIKRRQVIGERKNTTGLLTKNEAQFKPNQVVEQPEPGPVANKVLVDKSDWSYRETHDGKSELVAHETQKNVSEKEFNTRFEDKRYSDLVNGQTALDTQAPLKPETIHRQKIFASDESTFTEMEESRFEREQRAEEALTRKEKERGQGWSDEMSDEELTRFIQKNGIRHELDRRDYLMNKRYSMEVTLNLGFKVNDSTNSSAAGGNAGMNRDLGLSLEYFLAARSKTLDHFSLEADLRSGSNETYLNNSNAALKEFTYGLNAFWYPFRLPGTVEKNLLYVGLGFRRGSVAAETATEQADYNASVMPAFIGGFRYHFDNNFGLRLQTSLETFNLSLAETSTATATMPQEVSYGNLKVTGGFSFYF